MNLYKIIFGFGLSTLVKALCGLAIVKLMAMWLGPTAFGILGQLMTVVAIASMFAGGGVTNGLIKNLSEHQQLPDIRQRKLGAALKIFISVSVLFSLILLVYCVQLAEIIFNRSDMAWVFIVLAVSQWLVGFYNIVQALFSCLHDIKGLLFINVLGAVTGVIGFVLLIYFFRFEGAALGIVILPAITGLIAVATWNLRIPDSWKAPIWFTTTSDIRNLLSYSGVMLVAVIAVPFAQVFVRNLMGERFGWDEVGYWQGVLKLSDVYMQFAGMLLANYALPRFTILKTQAELWRYGARFGVSIVLTMAVGFCVIYWLRFFIIDLLYTQDFISMERLFLPQLCGDILRITGSVFVYLAISRGSRVIPIVSELIQAGGLVTLTWLILPWFQAASPVYAYLISSAILVVTMYVVYSIMLPKWFTCNASM